MVIECMQRRWNRPQK